MKSKLIATILVMTALGAGPAWAGSGASKWSITLNLVEAAGSTGGPCKGGDNLADYCPTGDCTCFTYNGTVSGSAGSGTATFFETFDNGGELGEPGTGTASECAPAYGDIEISGSKDLESVAFIGADCSSDFTATFLSGGCQIALSGVYLIGALGQCSGTHSTGANTKFTIKGAGGK